MISLKSSDFKKMSIKSVPSAIHHLEIKKLSKQVKQKKLN